MKNYITLLLCFVCTFTSNAQRLISVEEGYTPQVGALISMLNDMKFRVERTVGEMSMEETDFLLDENANSIGTLIMHLVATEKLYQVMTFENREFTDEESDQWSVAMNMGKEAQEKFKGKDVKEYLNIFKDVREKTLEYFKAHDDTWLAKVDERLNMNYHWAWYHVMEHQSSHLGQILLIRKRIPKE